MSGPDGDPGALFGFVPSTAPGEPTVTGRLGARTAEKTLWTKSRKS